MVGDAEPRAQASSARSLESAGPGGDETPHPLGVELYAADQAPTPAFPTELRTAGRRGAGEEQAMGRLQEVVVKPSTREQAPEDPDGI